MINSLGLKNALDLANKYKAKLLYLSSSAVYGEAPLGQGGQKFLFKENYQGPADHLGFHSCYVEGKRFGESLAVNYKNKYELDIKIARIFDVYGPRMKFLDGRIIPEMVSLALDNKNIMIEGDKNTLGAFCHVSDLIKGLTKIMSSSEAGPINLGNNWEIKLVDLAQKIIELTGSTAKIQFAEPKIIASRLTPKIPDIGLVKEKLGWFPVVLLEDGLKKMIEDLRASRGLINI